MTESPRAVQSTADADAVRAQVETSLDQIKTRLRGHGGDVVVGDITDGVVDLEFRGACRGCPAQGFTFVAVVEPAVTSVPEVSAVKSSRSHISPFVIDRIRRMSPAGATRRRDDQHPDRT